MLQLINIEKKYTTGDLTQAALNGVSLNLRDSEFVAVLGPSEHQDLRADAHPPAEQGPHGRGGG